MQVPESQFWAVWGFFALVFAIAIFIAFGRTLLYPRSERVGSIECRFESRMGASRSRLTIAREPGEVPMVHLRVRATGANLVFRMPDAQARQLAELLESGAARLREP